MLDPYLAILSQLIQTNGLPIAIVVFATVKLDKFLSALTTNMIIYNKHLGSLEITIVKLTGAIDNLKDSKK